MIKLGDRFIIKEMVNPELDMKVGDIVEVDVINVIGSVMRMKNIETGEGFQCIDEDVKKYMEPVKIGKGINYGK